MSFEESDVAICRACINECIEFKGIHRRGLILGELTTLATMLSYCTNLDFPEHEDFLPGNLCSGCIQNLVRLYAFKQTVIKSDETLRQQYSELNGDNQQLDNWQELAANASHQQKQVLDHSYVTLTVVHESDQQPDILHVHDEIEGDSSSQGDVQMDVQHLVDSSEQEIVYHEEESEMEEGLKVEEEEYESETYEVRLQDAASATASEVEDEQQNTTTKVKTENVLAIAAISATHFKVVRPRSKISERRPKNPEWQCKVCGKQLSNHSSFRYHMQLHSDATPFLCSLCGEGFKTRNAYDGHMSIHNPNNPNTCDICGKTYRQPSSLRTHMLTHTGEKPFQCDICGKGMTQRSGYKKHMLTHTGEKPHSCDICGREFRYSSNLISHKRHHTGEKPYDCPVCEKCFPTSEQLKRHSLVHTGEKPFSCEICSKRFNRRSSLAAHRHTHENTSSADKPKKKYVEHY